MINTRRTFLKHSTGMLGLLISPSLVSCSSLSDSAEKKSSVFGNGVSMETLFEGGCFVGLGNISVDGVALRSPRRPMFVEITTPDGVRFLNYRVVREKVSEEGIELDFSVDYVRDAMMEWMLHTVRNRRNLKDWTEGPREAEDTRVTLVIKPVTRMISGKEWKGFSYQYVYHSGKYPIYRILDRGTWEIGGNVNRNEFWMRNGSVPSKVKFKSKDDFYSTEWYLPGIENPNIFQFFPLQTTMQGFTFTNSPKGVLVTWANKVEHINSYFEKQKGKDEMAHFHEHCSDLLYDFRTSPMEVIWCPGEFDEVGLANIYESVKEVVYDTLHEDAGIKRERVSTYGVIEEWTIPDMDKYINKGVPALTGVGVRTIFIPNECQNAMNVYGVSNMCCNVDYKIADCVGEDKMKELCDKAAAGNARIEMWGNTAISSLTEMFSYGGQDETDRLKRLPVKGSIMEVVQKAKMPWIRNASNAIEADHYTPRFCALNMRDPDIYAYWMKCWGHFIKDLGLKGIFLDSSFNLTSNKFHYVQNMDALRKGGATLDQLDNLGFYRPEKEPEKGIFSQYHAYVDMIRDMQEMGYHYTGEDIGVFGIHRSGPGIRMRLDCLYIWTDCIAQFDAREIKKMGLEPVDVLFKGLAYRMMWFIYWDIKKEKIIPIQGRDDEFPTFDFFRIYNEVEAYMYGREILEGEKGVLYNKDNVYVLWAFDDFEHKLPRDAKVRDMQGGEITASGSVAVKKNHVYLYKI
ncbi:MAG: hypothetical protein SOR57_08625 [Parabacteroides sp.]|nr:hypothetical protein [Parabacteroides sp.]